MCVLWFLSCFFSFKQLEDLFNGDDQDAEGQVEEHLCVSPHLRIKGKFTMGSVECAERRP